MARYAEVVDCRDTLIRMEESILIRADTLVDGVLAAKGITPAEVAAARTAADESGPHPLLNELAIAYASEIAAREQARGDQSPLGAKADGYAKAARSIAEKINRLALGLVPTGADSTGTGYGSINIGRG